MCKTVCLFTVIAISIGLVNAWDMAITTGEQLEFYSNKTKTSDGTRFKDLTVLAYDAVHNMLLFVDKHNDNASIFSYHLNTKKYQALVRSSSANIQGLAFDPVKSLLFWTDTSEKNIFWISLQTGSKNDDYGNLLIKMDDERPGSIAVDSCRGYIYWTNTNITRPTIERAKFDGSKRQIIVNTDLFRPVSVVVDQRTKRIYWIDNKEGIHFTIESSDLEGKDRKVLLRGTDHQPNMLTISKDTIYWVDWGFQKVWEIDKDATEPVEPKEYLSFSDELPFGIAANYQISDQIAGTSECQALQNLEQNKSTINESFTVPKDAGLFCLHGIKEEGKLRCKCTPGYIGDRCEISVCYNYCLQGDCSLTPEGKPICRCNNGYSGTRCDANICDGYCLNYGVCTLNGDTPSCRCMTDYEGQRCETLKEFPTTTVRTKLPTIPLTIISSTTISSTKLPTTLPSAPVRTECNCTKDTPPTTVPTVAFLDDNMKSAENFVTSALCDETWDAVRDNVIIVLGVVCGLLCMFCTYLVTKVLQLKKRPRIKKRIIVNKNVTPMTARPDQCEITIENCCNMNICETPCFEPRSTIRPTLGDTKPGKEEKKNLIANMEYPENY